LQNLAIPLNCYRKLFPSQSLLLCVSCH